MPPDMNINRRELLARALALPVLGATWATPSVSFPPEKRPLPLPKFSETRPPILGVLGETYFHAPYCRPDNFLHCFLDGEDVNDNAFECDLTGQWIGKYIFNRDTGKIAHDGNGRAAVLYVRGHVELRSV